MATPDPSGEVREETCKPNSVQPVTEISFPNSLRGPKDAGEGSRTQEEVKFYIAHAAVALPSHVFDYDIVYRFKDGQQKNQDPGSSSQGGRGGKGRGGAAR